MNVNKKRIRLTAKGKRTLVTVGVGIGCLCGILLSAIFLSVQKAPEADRYVLAKESGTEQEETETEAANAQTPQWLFFESAAGETCETEWKRYIDALVRKWTKQKLTDDELSEQVTEYLSKRGMEVHACAVQSNALCLFPSAQELPDYTKQLAEGNGTYAFIGVYTQGQLDEEGRLICYYWEVGVR